MIIATFDGLMSWIMVRCYSAMGCDARVPRVWHQSWVVRAQKTHGRYLIKTMVTLLVTVG